MIQRTLVLALSAALALAPSIAGADPAKAKAKPKKAKVTKTVAPQVCTDFYSTVNNDWFNANKAPTGTAVNSAMAVLQANSLQQQRQLLDSAMTSPQNKNQKLLGDFWASGLDEASIESDGSKSIAPLIQRVNAIKRAKDIPAAIAALHQVGIPVAFNFSADIDLNDLDRHIGYFSQGGLGLPDSAFYTRTDPDTAALMSRYRDYVKNILTLTGSDPGKVANDVNWVMGIESSIAKFSKSAQPTRDPRSAYAAMPISNLKNQYRNLQLAEFIAAQGVKDDIVSMADPQYFAQLDALVKNTSTEQWKTYLRYQIGHAMAPYLSKSFRKAEGEFFGRVFRDQTGAPPRWQEVLSAINLAAGPMLGREYVSRYVPSATSARAESVAKEVVEALSKRIDSNTWMSATAKQEAKRKLEKTRIEVGAPRRDLDYTIQPMGRGSFGGNMLIASTWRHAQEMKRIGNGNADRRWDVLPQDAALGYDMAHNRIIITAAMLQAPVIDMSQPQASQYGALGALVGHELTRGFDNRGRMLDASGNIRDWWTPQDAAAWNTRMSAIAAQYSGHAYPELGGAKVNGSLTREQDTADLAGLELAWDALAKSGTPDAANSTAFFNGWARLWPQAMSKEAAALQQATSSYAPGKWRTNGPLVNMPEFATAFKCKAGTPMALPANKQVNIWR